MLSRKACSTSANVGRDPAHENAVVGLDRPEIAFIFSHLSYSIGGFYPGRSKEIPNRAHHMLRRVSGPGCGRWNTARTPLSATRTRLPAPSLISAPRVPQQPFDLAPSKIGGRRLCEDPGQGRRYRLFIWT